MPQQSDTLHKQGLVTEGAFSSTPTEEQKQQQRHLALPRWRGAAVGPEAYLAVKPSGAYVNLPPPIDVETVEEAKEMLARWEMWNSRLQQKLKADSAFSPFNGGEEQNAASSSSVPYSSSPSHTATDGDALLHPHRQGARAHSNLGAKRISENPGSSSTKPTSHTAAGPVRLFTVAYRTTAAAAHRKLQPESTRHSRALLLKRALDLEGKPLGRAGSGPDDAGEYKAPPVEESGDSELFREDGASPIGTQLSAAPTGDDGEKAGEEKETLAVAEHVLQRLQMMATPLAREPLMPQPHNDVKELAAAWPKPPSRLHRELSEEEESAKAIRLTPFVPLPVMEAKQPGQKRPTTGYAECGAISMGITDDMRENILTQQPPSLREVCDKAIQTNSPSHVFPVVLLEHCAVIIPPLTPMPLGDGETLSNAIAEGRSGTTEATEGANKEGSDIEMCWPVSIPTAKTTNSSEAEPPAVEMKGGRSAVVTSPEGNELMDEAWHQPVDPVEESHFEREVIPLVSVIEESVDDDDDDEQHQVANDVLNSSPVRELIAAEYVTRISLVMEERAHLCELWQTHCRVALCIAEACSTAHRNGAVETMRNDSTVLVGLHGMPNRTDNATITVTERRRWHERTLHRRSRLLRLRWLGRRRLMDKMKSISSVGNEVRDKVLDELPRSYQAEVDHLQQRLEREALELSNAKSELLATVEGLRRNNEALETDSREREGELAAQVQALETHLKEEQSTLHQVREEAMREANISREETARLNQELLQLQGQREMWNSVIHDLRESLQGSQMECSRLQQRLEREALEFSNAKSELQATVEGLRRNNESLETNSRGREGELAAQVQALKTHLKEEQSTLHQVREEAMREANISREETARLNQELLQLQGQREMWNSVIHDLRESLQGSQMECSRLQQRLEREALEFSNAKCELQATVEGLRRNNECLETDSREREGELAAQVQALETHLKEEQSTLHQVREEATNSLRCATEEASARERAANARHMELQREVLELTARELCAVRLADKLERELLLTHSREEEHITEMRLQAHELRDVERRITRPRAQTAAAMDIIGRCAARSLALRCLVRWARKSRETGHCNMVRLRRENKERQRELTLWRDYICLAETALRPSAAAAEASAAVVSPGSGVAVASARDVVGVASNTVGRSAGTVAVVGPASLWPSRIESPAMLGVKCMLARERERTAELEAERDALQLALRDSIAANDELLAQLQAALQGHAVQV